MLPEIVPEKGLAISSIMNWVCVALIGNFYPTLKYYITIGLLKLKNLIKYFCLGGSFILFSVITLCGFFFVLFKVHETKNKTYKEICKDYEHYELKNETVIIGEA